MTWRPAIPLYTRLAVALMLCLGSASAADVSTGGPYVLSRSSVTPGAAGSQLPLQTTSFVGSLAAPPSSGGPYRLLSGPLAPVASSPNLFSDGFEGVAP